MKTALQRVTIRIITMLLLRAFTYAGDVTTADTLIRAMHDRYSSSWYDTLTFTQKSTTYNLDGTTKVETWYEAALLPGKLRIDIGPPADGRAYLLANGNATLFEKGKDPRSRPLVYPGGDPGSRERLVVDEADVVDFGWVGARGLQEADEEQAVFLDPELR